MEPPPPDAARILRRIWVLACVSARGFLEGDDDMIGRERARREMLAWLRAVPLAGELEDQERAAIESPIGQLGERRSIDCGWRSEGIVVLLWSLDLGEIGPIDRQHEDPRALVEAAAYLEPDAASLLDRVRARPAEERDAYADLALNVHWRLREHQLGARRHDCRDLFGDPLPGVAAIALIGDDLAVGGRALRDAEAAAIHTTTSIATERQRAANWLVGQERLYADITLDT